MQKEESIYADVLKSAISWRVRDTASEVICRALYDGERRYVGHYRQESLWG